jgi:hypothetical protein
MMNDSHSTAKPLVQIYTDGGEPNPGAGGYGVVLLHPKTNQRKEASGGFREDHQQSDRNLKKPSILLRCAGGCWSRRANANATRLRSLRSLAAR